MSEKLADLKAEFDRSDQERKRMIGEYLHDRPGQWLSKQDLKDHFDIDESGVGRHLDDLHEAGYLQTTYDNGERFAQWNGPGAGGFVYWLRQILPRPIILAVGDLRPLFTLESLGGAYIPTIMFGFLLILGFTTGLFAIILSHAPMDSVFGITVLEAIGMTGAATVLASAFLVLIPLAKLLELSILKVVKWIISFPSRRKKEG